VWMRSNVNRGLGRREAGVSIDGCIGLVVSANCSINVLLYHTLARDIKSACLLV
jgi:hypothetical protein